MKQTICLLLAGLILTACAAGGGGAPAAQTRTELETKPELSNQQLRRELANISGAQVSETEPLRVSFPAGTLFAEEALLPMPGGAGQLDALAAVLRQSGLAWRLKLRATTGEGEAYDRQLAVARARVLQTYLQAAGVDLQKVELVTATGPGAPLEMSILN